jgi:transposase
MGGLDGMQAEQSTNGTEQLKRIKRQPRSAEERRRIVQELLASGSSVTEFARTHGLRANQLFKWRRLYQEGLLNGATANESVLLPVKIAEPSSVAISKPQDNNGRATGIIRIEFASTRVSIEGNVDAATVRAVLECLAK